MYENIIIMEKYLLPVIEFETGITDLKNIIFCNTNAYIYSDKKGLKQKNLLRFLNFGYLLIRVVFPVIIVFNCIILSVGLLRRLVRKDKH